MTVERFTYTTHMSVLNVHFGNEPMTENVPIEAWYESCQIEFIVLQRKYTHTLNQIPRN